jgi:RNA polymerase sigma-70 factor (ECF subfamily)
MRNRRYNGFHGQYAMTSNPMSTTDLAHRATQGDREAADQLMARLYRELHSMAQAAMNSERIGHTLQPTALVHEAFLKMVDLRNMNFNDGLHVRAMAAELMRRVLIDHARTKLAAKRGGGRERVTLSGLAEVESESAVDLVELDAALEALEKLNSRHCRVVELRFFGGMTHEQAAAVLGVSEQTVRLDWSMARAWLKQWIVTHRENN